MPLGAPTRSAVATASGETASMQTCRVDFMTPDVGWGLVKGVLKLRVPVGPVLRLI